jgi:hypothetical protein
MHQKFEKKNPTKNNNLKQKGNVSFTKFIAEQKILYADISFETLIMK